MSSSSQGGNVNTKPDPTANLPDEVLCSIISHIPSLRRRFKLAAVKNKFRRCVMKELNKPIPLKLYFHYERLNGHKVPIHRWPIAMQVLAPRTHFSHIKIVGGTKPSLFTYWADQLLYILSISDCLDQVQSFQSNLKCSAFLYAAVLSKCHKLSILRLDVRSLCPFPSESEFDYPFDLCSVVANKPLTQLKLHVSDYTQEDLIKVFKCLRQHTLQSLDLSFKFVGEEPNLIDLVRTAAVWSQMREIRLGYDFSSASALQLAELPQLSFLRSLTIDGYLDITEFFHGVMSLFNNCPCQCQQPFIVECWTSSYFSLYGCQVANLIDQLHQDQPGIQIDVDFYQEMVSRLYPYQREDRDEIRTLLRLKFGSVTCVVPMSPTLCSWDMCPQCLCVYAHVVTRLVYHAVDREKESQHLENDTQNFRLDRCRVERVVADLNVQIEQEGIPCRALFAVVDQIQDVVVIAFEYEDGDQCYITINRTHCLSTSCFGCLQI